MIDNFDQLALRCAAKRRIQMFRYSFLIVGMILLGVAIVAGYQTWFSSAVPKTLPKPVPKPHKILPAAPVAEANVCHIPLPKKPVVHAASLKAVKKSLPIENTAANVAPVPVPLSLVSKPQNNHVFEVDNEPKNALIDPLNAYNTDPKYETALAVARNFYAKNDFSDAAIWAKKANQMNREAEDAWLLYAKSYYAQGRKNDAIDVLELYINYKDSKAAAELLRNWKQPGVN